MKRFIIVATLFCSLFWSCSDDNNYAEAGEEVIDGLSLQYSVASLEAETYSVEPTEEELKMYSVFYIFVGNSSDKVLGSSFRSDLKSAGGLQGSLPFILPDNLPNDVGGYTVSVVVNWDSYIGGASEFNKIQARLANQEKAMAYLKKLTSSLNGDLVIPELSVQRPILLTGSFEYKEGGGNPFVQLQRKSVVFDVSVTLPEHIKVVSYSVEGMDNKVHLFNSDFSVSDPTLTQSLPILSNSMQFRFYTLPAHGNKMTFVMKTKYMNLVLDNQAVKLYKDEISDKEFRFPLSVDKLSSVFTENQYVRFDVFEPLNLTDTLTYSINDWSSQPFTGEYKRDAWGNGVGVSPSNLHFAFADTHPARVGATIPSGKISEEIYVAAHGNKTGWEVKFTDDNPKPNWLSVYKHSLRSTLVVEAEPNFELDLWGRIMTSPRSFSFNIIVKSLDGVEANDMTFPISIKQDASPTYPADVVIPTKAGKSLTIFDRYVGATSPNFFGNGGLTGFDPPVGAGDAKGTYYKNVKATVNAGCVGKWAGSRLMSSEEAVFYVYPRMRSREVYMGASDRTFAVFYLSDGKNMAFFNLSGREGDYAQEANSVSIYTNDADVQLPLKDATNYKYCIFLGTESFANVGVDQVNGHLVRCVKQN